MTYRAGIALLALLALLVLLAFAPAPAVIWSASAVSSQDSKAPRIVPIDEGASEPGLQEVRRAILRAAKSRSLARLAREMGPEFKLDFDAPTTPDAFVKSAAAWPPEIADEFWRDVEDAMRLPMARLDDGFVAPYVFVSMDAYDEGQLAIVGDRVALRAAPSLSAPVRELLSYEVVTPARDTTSTPAYVREPGHMRGWYAVTTAAGSEGWVFETYARSAIAMRLHFRKLGDRWRLVSIVSGD